MTVAIAVMGSARDAGISDTGGSGSSNKGNGSSGGVSGKGSAVRIFSFALLFVLRISRSHLSSSPPGERVDTAERVVDEVFVMGEVGRGRRLTEVARRRNWKW